MTSLEDMTTEELYLELEKETDEYRIGWIKDEIVKKNVKLVHNYYRNVYFNNNYHHKICSQHRITEDDLFAIGLEGLEKSMRKFDPSLGYKFSTLLYKILFSEYYKYFERVLDKHKDNRSTEEVVWSNANGDDITVMDSYAMKSSTFDLSEEAIVNIQASTLMGVLTKKFKPRDMEIFFRLMTGEQQHKIAKDYGLSQVQVSRIGKAIRKKAKEILSVT